MILYRLRCGGSRFLWSVVLAAFASPVLAQQPVAVPPAAPDDTPSIRLGATIFTNYTFQQTPKLTDADGNLVSRNSFDVARAYLNVTGTISHLVAFRITPDISRETNTASSLAGSLELRIKYAYLQANFDDWMTRGSYARLGIQQAPYLDYLEGIYRYRFQGTMFAERAGYFASADAGASFHYNLPADYGDIHVGVFNGENYNKAEVNDQKAIMLRGSVRPFAAGASILRGLRVTAFYDGDHYIKDAERTRFLANATVEHRFATVGVEYLRARDRPSARPEVAAVEGQGFSVWVTPRQSATGTGWEALLRYDQLTPNTDGSAQQNRVIAGIAYWFPHQGAVTSALMVDYDAQLFKNVATVPVKSIAVHALINF